MNRLTAVHFPDPAQDIAYTYDEGEYGKGRRTGMSDSSGDTEFQYDSKGRLVSQTTTVSGVAYPLTRAFTASGRLDAITYPTGRRIAYSHYANGKIRQASTTHNSVTTTLVDNLAYKPFGKPTALSLGSWGTVNNQSAECDCLEMINPGEQMEQSYTYDHKGNLLYTQEPNTPWANQYFNYDLLNRLTRARGPYGTIDYTYDKVGNRLTRTIDGQSDTYSYIPETSKVQGITGTNPVAFTYDGNGNVTGFGSKALVYNQNNRLVRVEEGSDVLGEYTYNGLGQRVSKVVDGVTTIFHYDFDGNIIGESSPEGVFSAEYLYLGSSRTAKVDVSTGDIYFYLNNYLGTPVLMTDDSGTVVWEAAYKPFGEAEVNPQATVVNNFRFPGQYYDQETGFHYNYHRYYDPGTGRYLRADPIGVEGGLNQFEYAENNPINSIDPLGLITYESAQKIPNMANGAVLFMGLVKDSNLVQNQTGL